MVNKFLERAYVLAMLLLIIVVFTGEFFPSEALIKMKIALITLVLLLGLILARGIPFYFSVMGLLLGHILFWKYNLDYEIWLEGITKNLPLTILFVVVPILSIPLRLGGYLDSFHHFISRYSNKVFSLFTVLTGILFGLSSITNLGSVRIIHGIIEEIQFPTKFLAKVFLVGFTSSIAWSPYFGSVNLALYYTGVSFNEYVLWGFLYGIGLFMMGLFFFYKDQDLQSQTSANLQAIKVTTENSDKFKQLGIVLLGLFLAVIIGEKLFSFSSMMLLVSAIAVIYGSAWAALIKKFPEFLAQLKEYPSTVLQVKNESVFFLAVGFFGVVLANTPLKGVIESMFQSIVGYYTFVVIAVIMFFALLLGALGVHMVIIVTVLGLALSPETLGLHPIAFALTLLGAWQTATVVCPIAPFNIVSAGLIKTTPFTLCYKWNRNHAFRVAIFSTTFVTIANWILL